MIDKSAEILPSPKTLLGNTWIPDGKGSRDLPKETSRSLWISCVMGSKDRPKETSRRFVDSLCHGK